MTCPRPSSLKWPWVLLADPVAPPSSWCRCVGMDDNDGDDDDDDDVAVRATILEDEDDDAVRRFPPFDDTLRWTLILCVGERGLVSAWVKEASGEVSPMKASDLEPSSGRFAPCFYSATKPASSVCTKSFVTKPHRPHTSCETPWMSVRGASTSRMEWRGTFP